MVPRLTRESVNSRLNERPCVEEIRCTEIEVNILFWPTHMCIYTHVHTTCMHTYTYTQMR